MATRILAVRPRRRGQFSAETEISLFFKSFRPARHPPKLVLWVTAARGVRRPVRQLTSHLNLGTRLRLYGALLAFPHTLLWQSTYLNKDIYTYRVTRLVHRSVIYFSTQVSSDGLQTSPTSSYVISFSAFAIHFS
jgi:hypothetical protein